MVDLQYDKIWNIWKQILVTNCIIDNNYRYSISSMEGGSAHLRMGENTKNVREIRPKMFENLDNPEPCPVTTHLAYKQQRPLKMMDDDSPFYLAIKTEVPKAGKKWFKVSPLGVNALTVFTRV